MTHPTPVYESDPGAAPDSEFEPGTLAHLVAGNRGRMLDPRRTPVTIVAVRSEVGFCTMRVEAFEDEGALWDIPFEQVDRFQFDRGSRRASPSVLADHRTVVDRLHRQLEISCDPAERRRTEAELAAQQQEAAAWLTDHSSFVADGGALPGPEQRLGDPRLFDDVEAYLAEHDVAEVEARFSQQFVSNPGAGEIVKGHRIVLAQMGLVPYRDNIVRDPATFEGLWDRANRRRHILVRLGFVRALFARFADPPRTIYRGMFLAGPVDLSRNRTFVSWTFSRAVAESHFDTAQPGARRMLQAQELPVDRVLMTFLETRAMNEQFHEAEAILLVDTEHPLY